MKNLIPFVGAVLVMVFGCAMPTSQVRTVDDRPGLIIKNAPKGSILFVDGINTGSASQFDGNPKFLVLRPGKHRVEIQLGGGVVQSMDIFLGEGTKKEITVPDKK